MLFPKHIRASIKFYGLPSHRPQKGSPTTMKSILQDWVQELGLRYQGVLISAVRGPDIGAKHDAIKRLVRGLRADVLNAHVGDPKKAKSFIEPIDDDDFVSITSRALLELDPLPMHYVMHLAHACEILGYLHPELEKNTLWLNAYHRICKKLHLNPEHLYELNRRLDADEDTFFDLQE